MTSKSKNGSYNVGSFVQKILKQKQFDKLKVKKSVYTFCETYYTILYGI